MIDVAHSGPMIIHSVIEFSSLGNVSCVIRCTENLPQYPSCMYQIARLREVGNATTTCNAYVILQPYCSKNFSSFKWHHFLVWHVAQDDPKMVVHKMTQVLSNLPRKIAGYPERNFEEAIIIVTLVITLSRQPAFIYAA